MTSSESPTGQSPGAQGLSGSLRVPARLEHLDTLRLFALEGAIAVGLGPDVPPRLELALEEALVNVINHAYPPGVEGEVELRRQPEPDAFTLVLTDWGPAFDPLHDEEHEPALQANREADLDSRAPGGLGLLLIRTMSQASYRRTAEANELTLRFPLPTQM
jgi:sigma-B regulation protein RsbU (phosphoserine phosphatase)